MRGMEGKKTKVDAKTKGVGPVKAVKPKEDARVHERCLSSREFGELERSVCGEVAEFEEEMEFVLNRYAWAALLKDSVKHRRGVLTDNQMTRLEALAKAFDNTCWDDAVELTLNMFTDDACRRRRMFAFEHDIREAESHKPREGRGRSKATGGGNPRPKSRGLK